MSAFPHTVRAKLAKSLKYPFVGEDMDFSGAVLNGGSSTRMGKDKAEISFKNKRLIDISLEALAGARANEIFIVGGASRVAEDSLNILYCQDMFPGEGPLGGIISALSVAEYDVLVTLPCDHLYVTSQVVEQCLAALSIHEMACPLLEDTKQVLCSAWRKSGLKKLKEIFDSGTRSVMDAVSLLDVVTFQVSNPEILRTANTIDELWQ